MARRRVVIAPDSFKGTIRAAAAARALAVGWHRVAPGDDLVLLPMADGGEGTLEALAAAAPRAEWRSSEATGPDDRPVHARWLRLPDGSDHPGGVAVVELAAGSGLELLAPGDLRPLDAHTAGFGQLLADACRQGADRVLATVGGSASTDGGAGALTALGAVLRDSAGRPIVAGARGLLDLEEADLGGLLSAPRGGVEVLADVTNPLTGPAGAARVFGAQKGLAADDVLRVDAALGRFAGLLGVDPATPGAGAGGGTAAGLLAWGARIRSGADAVAEAVGLRAAVAGADLVITGEGSYDAQTGAGKAPGHVRGLAEEAGVPLLVVAGRLDVPGDRTGMLSLTDLAGSPEVAMTDAASWLERAGALLARA